MVFRGITSVHSTDHRDFTETHAELLHSSQTSASVVFAHLQEWMISSHDLFCIHQTLLFVCKEDISRPDVWQQKPSLLIEGSSWSRFKDGPGKEKAAQAEAGRVVNRMEQPSALFWVWYVQEKWLHTFLNISCKRFLEKQQNNCTSASVNFRFSSDTLKHNTVQQTGHKYNDGRC